MTRIWACYKRDGTSLLIETHETMRSDAVRRAISEFIEIEGEFPAHTKVAYVP